MLTKRLAILAIATSCCWGCRQGGNDQQVGELLAKQEEHTQNISGMLKQMDAIDERLAAIEKKIEALLPAGSAARPGGGAEMTVASSFASTKEYQDIMRQINLFGEQLAAVQGDFVGLRDRQGEARSREALRDPRSAFRAMGDPKQLSDRLDNLVKNASGRIGDPDTREQFAVDVENLKAKYSAVLSPEEKREQARALVEQSLNSMTDDRRRGWLEGQLRSLDEASGEDLDRRVNMALQFQKMREISDLTQKYNIPSEVVRDSGLMSFGGRGGPGGFGQGRGRRGR